MDDKRVDPFLDKQRAQAETKGIFDRIKSMFPFFVQKESREAKLVGRIRIELQKDAWEVLNKLKMLRETLKTELNDHSESQQLWTSIEAVVNPLMREYGQIEKKLMERTDSIETNTAAIKNYNDWIVKAKLWVALCSRSNDRNGIIQAVIIHTKQVSDDIIERDLKMLNDYKLHEIQNIGLNFQEIEATSIQIDKAIFSHVEGLRTLKNKNPTDLKLESLIEWKAEMDEARTKHYEAALHCIDTIIQSVAPNPIKEDELGHLKEIFERLAYLEEELPIFLGHLKRVNLKDEVTKQMLEGQLVFLEEEVHKLNRDLRLTPELADRVALIIHELTQAHVYF
jgi:hypothetical protein